MNAVFQEMVKIVLTLAVGGAAGYSFMKLKVPGGMLVGAIVGAAVVNLGFQMGYVPPAMKTAAQITAGAFIGTMVSRDDLQKLKSVYKVGGVVIGSYVLINIVIGYVIYLMVPYDLLTCLMCTIPGGMSDVPLIAADMGADVAPVVVIHFARIVVGIGIFPTVISLIGDQSEPNEEPGAKQKEKAAPRGYDRKKTAVTIFLATMFGLIGKWVGIPVGALVFAMIGIAAVKLIGYDAQIPRWVKRVAQALSGTYIGCSISRNSLSGMSRLILPTLIVIAAYVVNMLLTGKWLHKKLNVPAKEAMLMLTPAGAGDMALISQDIGVDSPVLITVQVLRLFVADALLPQVCGFLASVLGA